MTKATLSPEDILVQCQPTPNPWALKFIANQAFKKEGKATFSSSAECEKLPLAQALFQVAGVKQIHFFKNVLTVTHSGEREKEELAESVTSVIKTRLPIHDSNFELEETPKQMKREKASSPEMEKIEEILDRTIRPGLQADGGDLDVISFENNEVKILYQGACGGCPSALMGTLDAIQSILRHEMGDETLRVRPI